MWLSAIQGNVAYPEMVDAVEEQLPGALAARLALAEEASVPVSQLPAEARPDEAVSRLFQVWTSRQCDGRALHLAGAGLLAYKQVEAIIA